MRVAPGQAVTFMVRPWDANLTLGIRKSQKLDNQTRNRRWARVLRGVVV
jgi:hypothetical protein